MSLRTGDMGCTPLSSGGGATLSWSDLRDDLEWLYGSDYFHTLVVELRAYDPLWAAAEVPGGRFPAVIDAGRGMARGLASEDPADALEPRHSTRTVQGDAAAYELTAVLLGEGVFTLRPAVLVTVTRPESPLPDWARLRERFGLTRRQAEVALLLAQRKTDPEVAELLCISPYTARGHAEAVMGKVGVHDRREIGRTIAEAAPPSNRGE